MSARTFAEQAATTAADLARILDVPADLLGSPLPIHAKPCSWCGQPIPSDMRVDAECCSTRCRQARHRFTRGVGRGVARGHGRRLRLAYADPPYPGRSKRYYGKHPDYAGEVDHAALIASLVEGYDGWALSTSADALQNVLALCPPGVRIGPWVRGERPTRSHGPLNAWEPVIYFGGRAEASRSTSETTDAEASFHAGGTRRIDSLVFASRPRTTDPKRVIGAKPATFCRWIFDLLGAEPGDEFVDVFPGSGGVARAWDVFVEAGSSLQYIPEESP